MKQTATVKTIKRCDPHKYGMQITAECSDGKVRTFVENNSVMEGTYISEDETKTFGTVDKVISARYSSMLGEVILNVICTDGIEQEVVQWDDSAIKQGAEFDCDMNDKWLKMDRL
jgi:hypothetical protein